jgi:hypothetical protein
MKTIFRRILVPVVSVSFAFLLIGFPCGDALDGCVDPVPFRIIDKGTRRNALLGLNARYSRDSISFLLTDYQSGIAGYKELYLNASTLSEDDLQVQWYQPHDTLLIRLTYKDIDTLVINYSAKPSECCGNFSTITSIQYNRLVSNRLENLTHRPFVLVK